MNISEPFIRRTDRDRPADGGNRICRPRGSAAFAGRAAAAGRLSDHIGGRHTARRQRGDHGGIGGGAAGTSIRPNSGVTQLTSVSALNSTSITIQFDLNRNIDSAGQDVQAAITVAGRTLPQQMSIAAELQEGQSGQFAGHGSGGAIRYVAPVSRSTTMSTISSPSRFPRFQASHRHHLCVNKIRRSISRSILPSSPRPA